MRAWSCAGVRIRSVSVRVYARARRMCREREHMCIMRIVDAETNNQQDALQLLLLLLLLLRGPSSFKAMPHLSAH